MKPSSTLLLNQVRQVANQKHGQQMKRRRAENDKIRRKLIDNIESVYDNLLKLIIPSSSEQMIARNPSLLKQIFKQQNICQLSNLLTSFINGLESKLQLYSSNKINENVQHPQSIEQQLPINLESNSQDRLLTKKQQLQNHLINIENQNTLKQLNLINNNQQNIKQLIKQQKLLLQVSKLTKQLSLLKKQLIEKQYKQNSYQSNQSLKQLENNWELSSQYVKQTLYYRSQIDQQCHVIQKAHEKLTELFEQLQKEYQFFLNQQDRSSQLQKSNNLLQLQIKQQQNRLQQLEQRKLNQVLERQIMAAGEIVEKWDTEKKQSERLLLQILQKINIRSESTSRLEDVHQIIRDAQQHYQTAKLSQLHSIDGKNHYQQYYLNLNHHGHRQTNQSRGYQSQQESYHHGTGFLEQNQMMRQNNFIEEQSIHNSADQRQGNRRDLTQSLIVNASEAPSVREFNINNDQSVNDGDNSENSDQNYNSEGKSSQKQK